MHNIKVVTVLSGGIDSTVVATVMRDMVRGRGTQLCVSFNYGQRHVKELDAAERVARHLEAHHMTVDLPHWDIAGISALTGEVDVPHGHYAADNMKVTVVPNRNAIMLALAFGIAGSVGADYVAAGMHAGDHPVYPDCRPVFTNAFARMEYLAFGEGGPQLTTPFIHADKATVVYQGHQLGAPLHLTWSCYEGGDVHCGMCATCGERRWAFSQAEVPDPTAYAVSLEETARTCGVELTYVQG
jgi:7-cyano-7-deazaguanine synthase